MLCNPIDFDRLAQDVLGRLLWRPAEFWASQAHETSAALTGYYSEREDDAEAQSFVTAALVNGMREAQAKRFKPKKARDYFLPAPDPDSVALARADAPRFRQVLDSSPATLPASAFGRGA